MNGFSATVDDWVKQTEPRLTAVFRESAQRIASKAANGVPVDTGFARASVRASLSEMPSIDPTSVGEEGQRYPDNFGNVSLTIANAKLGDTIYVGWTAAYVGHLEYGTSRKAPLGFVRLAAAQWQMVVDAVTAEAKGVTEYGQGDLAILGSDLLPY